MRQPGTSGFWEIGWRAIKLPRNAETVQVPDVQHYRKRIDGYSALPGRPIAVGEGKSSRHQKHSKKHRRKQASDQGAS